MTNYYISPKKGWLPDQANNDLVEYLYAKLMPFVNSGNWNYYNFVSNQGWFEQEGCGSLFVEFMSLDNEEGEIGFIKSLTFKLTNPNSIIHEEMVQISNKYWLNWSIADDS
ncbi:hypothetical protein PN836_004210 [Ningiella sp. W23]|uniref:hypothetical protein n=1 Tax=Ningiella sp. W23 TaxID=3023715 RepID=UPI003758073D